jgi:hypothetical protein
MASAWERADPKFRAYLKAVGCDAASYNGLPLHQQLQAYNISKQEKTSRSVVLDHGSTLGQETALGSRSHPSHEALKSLIETIDNTEFSVNWCGDCDFRHNIRESPVCDENSVDLLAKRLRISMEGITGNGLEDLDFLRLRRESESDFQNNHLTKALDLSGKCADGPFFKSATITDDVPLYPQKVENLTGHRQWLHWILRSNLTQRILATNWLVPITKSWNRRLNE